MFSAKRKPESRELIERLNDPAFRAEIEEAVANMPPEKAAELVAMLEDSLRRRKLELIGYLAAALVVLVGMVVALYIYGAAPRDTFVGWVFLVPLAIAGVIMMWVGRLARPRSGRAAAEAGKAAAGKPAGRAAAGKPAGRAAGKPAARKAGRTPATAAKADDAPAAKADDAPAAKADDDAPDDAPDERSGQ